MTIENQRRRSDEDKALKAWLLLTGQVESDRFRNWTTNVKDGSSSNKQIITYDQWKQKFLKKAKSGSSNNLGNLRPLYPGEGNIIHKQLVQRQRDRKAMALITGDF